MQLLILLRRLLLVLPTVVGLGLATGGCAVPLAVTAGSYAADGALLYKTDKTSTDHLVSMASKKDCAVWRIFRHQSVCKDRPDGAKDPYEVNYDEPFRGPSESGVQYGPPLNAAPDAPAASWDVAAYAKPEPPPQKPVLAIADASAAPSTPIQNDAVVLQPASKVRKAKPSGRSVKKKSSPSPAATAL